MNKILGIGSPDQNCLTTPMRFIDPKKSIEFQKTFLEQMQGSKNDSYKFQSLSPQILYRNHAEFKKSEKNNESKFSVKKKNVFAQSDDN